MDLSSILDSLQATLGQSLPNLLTALAILIVGWIVAVVLRALVRKSLVLLKLNQLSGGRLDLESGVARGAYYLVLVLALIAFFNALDLPLVSAPLEGMVDKFLTFLPNLIAGLVLGLVAWILATLLRKIATKALSATSMDEKLSAEAGMQPMSRSVGHVLYGLVLLLFLPAVLGALKLDGLLVPVRDMVDQILGFLPNLAAAFVFGAIGWFVARLLRNMVTSLLEAAGADKLGQRAGLKGTMTLSGLVGLVVFIFVLVPTLIQALDVLQIETISKPATEVLASFMSALPKLFAAAVILAVAFLVSGFVANLATSLLGGLGFDGVPARLGLGSLANGGTTPSQLVGKLIVFFVVLFAVVEAAGVLGFTQVANLVETLIEFGGQVLLGVVIIAVGIWMANLAHGAITRLGRPHSALMAGLARFTILGVVFAMGLRAMDLANEIVNAAFYLTLGSVAVALALSFGLGGREAAGKQMEFWLAKLRREN